MLTIVVRSVLVVHSCLVVSSAFYVPGVAPVEFRRGQAIEVKAVKMTSVHTQLPYEYYSLPLCRPKNGTLVYKSENLGEVLRGDRIVNTPYELRMAENVACQLLCHKKHDPINWSADESQKVAGRIQHEYRVHLLVDNLPVSTRVLDKETLESNIEQGYRLGFVSEGKAYLNNHLKLLLKYHKHSQDSYRVVGFEVETLSVDKEQLSFVDESCQLPAEPRPQLVNEETGTRLYFTYSVQWTRSDVSWASRWDMYLAMKDAQVHWFSIINSVIVVFFLSGLLTLIMVRTLRRDIARYNAGGAGGAEELLAGAGAGAGAGAEDTGWKLLHGDVFRPPPRPALLAALVGSGVQLFLMALITILIAMLGMLSPASRGALTTAAILLYVCAALPAGWAAARLHGTLRAARWRRAALLTATLYPGVVACTCFLLNFLILGKRSSGAVPFSTMAALLCLWVCISLPLVYVGFHFGRRQPFQHPVRTNYIPRKVPDQRWYMSYCFSVLAAGVVPFGAVFIELLFIFSALWENQFYYLFGFLFLVFCILVVCVAQIAVVMLYLQLCGEDYHWWWRSFIVSGGSAVYVLLYSVLYFFKLDITEFIPTLLYFGYTGLMVLTFWLLTGTIGFLAAYSFIRHIYGAVKID